jgi:glycosyltransferase involved in cell wall biosynthesis
MKILFIADGRSPTALNWLRYWIETGHDTHLLSTFPCDPPAGLTSFHIMPVAFASMAGNQVRNSAGTSHGFGLVKQMRRRLRRLRYLFGPFSLAFYQGHYHTLVSEIQPELVHALRIPFEGMLAINTPAKIPVVVSTWGNDLTLHAQGSFFMSRLTRATLYRADGLITDTQRDIHLSYQMGFIAGKPTLTLPGSGGIRLSEIEKASKSEKLPEELPDVPIIVNPRGQRPGSLRQDIFFQAVRKVIDQLPHVLFVCPSLQGDIESERCVDKLGIQSKTRLWPRLSQAQLWKLFQKSQVFVSPSVHDGTPNSLLEAMACGCFPVVGNIDSMKEWVETGVNGILVDASDAYSMAGAIVEVINQPALRKEAARINARLISKRAAYDTNMAHVDGFYRSVISTAEVDLVLQF